MIRLDRELYDSLTHHECEHYDPADLEMLALLRKYGPQPATALVTALGVKRSTVNFRAGVLGRLVDTIKAPGRGNVTVYAAA